jgi:hypothetical protein
VDILFFTAVYERTQLGNPKFGETYGEIAATQQPFRFLDEEKGLNLRNFELRGCSGGCFRLSESTGEGNFFEY